MGSRHDEFFHPEVGVSNINPFVGAKIVPMLVEPTLDEVNSLLTFEAFPFAGNLACSSLGIVFSHNSLAIWLAIGVKAILVPFVEDLGEVLLLWSGNLFGKGHSLHSLLIIAREE